MPNPNQPIIKKVKKVQAAGHHGGAWKVAYADFVTAMMAFFLLMWLLNATTEEQKRGISNYFGPVGLSTAASGSGGLLGGQSVSTDGSFEDSKASPAVTMLAPQTNAGEAKAEGDESNQPDKPAPEDVAKASEQNIAQIQKEDSDKQAATGDKAQEAVAVDKAQEAPVAEEDKAAAAAIDKKNFDEAQEKIKQAILNSPELAAFADNLVMDITPEGLRIQIVDQDKRSMFPSGEKKMYDHTVMLLNKIAGVIKTLPNKISIAGHTDSTPYNDGSGYTNWELSADRANASRQVLTAAGLDEDRISQVAGKAATEPFNKDDPSSPQNRRISITLLNMNTPSPQAEAQPTAAK